MSLLRRLIGREHPARVAIVAAELRRRSRPRYLEIGVDTGVLFLHVRARHKTGVDPVGAVRPMKRLLHPNSLLRGSLLTVTSDAFFAALAPDARFDVIFVDGDHGFEQSLRDVEHALDHLAEDGVVLVHDCDPPTAEAASADPRDARGGPWCGEVFKTIATLRATRPDLIVEVLEIDFGVGVIRRGTSAPLDIDPAQIASMSFTDLAADRERLLGIR